MKSLCVVLAILGLVGVVTPPTAQAISLVERGWVATAPRADRAGDSMLPDGFSEQTRNALDARFGIVLIVLIVAGLALAAYTVRVAFVGEHPAPPAGATHRSVVGVSRSS